MITYELTEPIAEGTTAQITFTLKDESLVVIPLDQIATFKLTLFNERSRTIINARNAQDVRNANNVTVHSTSGLVTWLLQPLDTAIENFTNAFESRIALFAWTFASTKAGKRQIRFIVKNLDK
jgi:hypothetical protein